MSIHKDNATGKWRVVYRYTDWTGETHQSSKRGFPTKREAQMWERELLLKKEAKLDMTFESFYEIYVEDMQNRIRDNTWGTKTNIARTKILPYFGKRKIGEIEPRDIIAFSDWAFTFVTSFLYYQDYDTLEEAERNVYRKGMECFGGIAPTYHIELLDKPTIVWDFHSLMLAIQMMFSFMITDENSTLKLCKHCGKIFVASRSNVQFCSPQCKNQHNVYKCRAKREDSE